MAPSRTLTRLRDRAIVELAALPLVTQALISRLDARHVAQDVTGLLVLVLGSTRIRLPRQVTGPLLEYLEAWRLWGSAGPLFLTRARRRLARSTIATILKRSRRWR
ncbi:MAG: hypothetical protein AAGC60_20785 [Acidobacteriota bacterium]